MYSTNFDTNDEYYTRKETWELIQDFIPRDKIIWECFYSKNSKSADYLKEISGCEVIYEDINFFNNDKGEVLISNMPFSLKQSVFLRLFMLEKPFIMIVPTTTLQTKYFKNIFQNSNELQLIIPSKKIQFDSLNPNQKNDCSFYSIFVCWKMNFSNDINFV